MSVQTLDSHPPAAFRTHDPRLQPIAAKVLAGERLDLNRVTKLKADSRQSVPISRTMFLYHRKHEH
jgi:hypothetical protein